MPNVDAQFSSPDFRATSKKVRTPDFAGVLQVELGGLEPPTSWVRSSLTQSTKSADLLAVPAVPAQIQGGKSCLGLQGIVGLWSTLSAARTSGGAALVAAPSSSEPDRSGEVNLKG